MTQQTFTREQFFAELDALGILKVREKHAVGAWGQVGPKVKLVELYIAEHDRAAAAAVETEQTSIAREAKEAAERSAAASERSAAVSERSAAAAERSADNSAAANRRATLALWLAAASILVQLIVPWLKPA